MMFSYQRQPVTFLIKFTVAGVKCRVAAIKCLPILHYSADCFFISFRVLQPVLATLKIGYRLRAYLASQRTVLFVKRPDRTGSPIIVSLCVLCFQWQSFRLFIY